MKEKLYQCSSFDDFTDMNSLDEIYYFIRNDLLHVVKLKNWLEISQRHEINATVETRNWSLTMHYSDVYLTDWRNVIDVRNRRGEEELEDWIKKCEKLDVNGLSEALKKM